MKKQAILPLACLGALVLTCAAVIAQQAFPPYQVPVQNPFQEMPNPGMAPDQPNYVVGRSYYEQGPQPAQLAQKYVKTEKEDEKKELQKKLMDVLNKQFDQHVEQQQKEVEQLEKQIAELKAVLKKRVEAKTAIVNRRFEQLLQDAQGLGWTVPSGPRSQNTPFGVPSTAAPGAPAPKKQQSR